MYRRKSDIFLWWLAANTLAMAFVFFDAFVEGRNNAASLGERINMVQKYELTDLCLFTDARYTRNPAMADLGTPFQDYPLSMEHFPSGSIIAPPTGIQTTLGPAAAVSWEPGKRLRNQKYQGRPQ
jgi:hypothetical protein